MATIDVDALRAYLEDYYGTALMSGLWPALADLGTLDALSGRELCELAEREGVDLRQFAVSP
ncbi:hypothetical protein [uncultured Adlercreutzia sp.]|uniref:hypothetical protein n=1 Tax=uncultured Adlercreutzia sp. TaxID=875803 RepID=UPI0025EA6853|nr:hypothetical protein [uncultured Adlercreutzia sp.]